MDTFTQKVSAVVREILATSQQPQALPGPTGPTVEPSSAAREESLQRLTALRKRQLTQLPILRDEVARLGLAVKELDAKAAPVRTALADKQRGLFGMTHALSLEVNQLVSRLEATPPAPLVAFLTEIDDELIRLREYSPSKSHEIGPRNRFTATMSKTTIFHSDSPSLQRRVVAIVTTRRRAEALRSEPMSAVQLTAEIDRLRTSWPAIEQEMLEPHARPVVLA